MDKISDVVSSSVVTSAKFLYNSYDSVVNNTETNLNKKIGYGKGYLYPHNYKDHFVKENYFPEKNEQQFFYPTEQGYEAWIKKRLSILWDNKFKND